MSKLDLSKCWVDYIDLNFGQSLYVCRSRERCCPVGLVWGIPHYPQHRPGKPGTYGAFEVYGSFIPYGLRRQGVRSFINREILKTFKAISSSGASEDGKKFMESAGYKKDDLFGWIIKRPVKRLKRK